MNELPKTLGLWTLSIVQYPDANSILYLSKGPNRVGAVLPSSVASNRPSSKYVVFSDCLEIRTIYEVHKRSDSKWYAQSSEPFNLTPFPLISKRTIPTERPPLVLN
jgi:hypothetical protein